MAISLGILTQHFQTNPAIEWGSHCLCILTWGLSPGPRQGGGLDTEVDRLLQQLEDLGWKKRATTGMGNPERELTSKTWQKTRENHRKTSGVHEKNMEILEESD